MTTTEPDRRLAGLRIFIAEDEFHVLELIEEMLAELGCSVVESTTSVPLALERAAATQAEVALLDVNLRGKTIFAVAEILRDRAIPVVFSTGYGAAGIDPEWKGSPVIQKPFAIGQLASALRQAAGR